MPVRDECLRIEVVYARAERQVLLALDVVAGTTLREAVKLSGIAGHFPGEFDPATVPLGVFGRRVQDPQRQTVQAGDRIELYRPLPQDPNDSRKARARQAKQRRAAQ